jgi:hypothetical protein
MLKFMARSALVMAVIVVMAMLASSAAGQGDWSAPQSIGRVTFLSEPGVGYTIMSDCSILVNGRRVAEVRMSNNPNYAWFYYIPRTGASYGVDPWGSVWASGYGVVGQAVWSRGCSPW